MSYSTHPVRHAALRKLALAAFCVLGFTLAVMAQKPYPVPAAKDRTCYLFAYFTGNNPDQEQIRFAVSKDGRHFFALNGDKPVLDAKTFARTGGVRAFHLDAIRRDGECVAFGRKRRIGLECGQ